MAEQEREYVHPKACPDCGSIRQFFLNDPCASDSRDSHDWHRGEDWNRIAHCAPPEQSLVQEATMRFVDGKWKPATKRLVLHIEVPGFYVEDLQENAAEFDLTIEDIVLEEMMRGEVGLTVVTLPGEKCLNSEFDVVSRTGQIVGAEIRDA